MSLQTSDTAAMPAPGVCTSIMTARNKKNGIGTISNPERFFNQDFRQMRQLCQERNFRYVDDTFPPDRRSIGPGVLNSERLSRVEWKRPYVSVYSQLRVRGVILDHSKGTSAVESAAIRLNWRNNHSDWQQQLVKFWNYTANLGHWSFKCESSTSTFAFLAAEIQVQF